MLFLPQNSNLYDTESPYCILTVTIFSRAYVFGKIFLSDSVAAMMIELLCSSYGNPNGGELSDTPGRGRKWGASAATDASGAQARRPAGVRDAAGRAAPTERTRNSPPFARPEAARTLLFSRRN